MPDQDSTIVRRCQKCKVEKPLDEFHRHAGAPLGRQYRCKACLAAYVRKPETRARNREISQKRYDQTREIMQTLKSRPCMDCGGSFPHYVMEFDHPNRAVKTGTISQMVTSSITQRVLDEIAKCDLVCANCHRVRTRGQFERGEYPAGRPRLDPPSEVA